MTPTRSRAMRLLMSCVLLATAAMAKPWKSAEMITSQQFKYGAFEARIRGAEGSGMITAFFLYKNGSEWEGAEWQEQDFELFGKNGLLQSQLMTPGTPRVEHVVLHQLPTNIWERYYTYRMEWTPTALSFYIDGKLVRRETDAVLYAKLLDATRAEPMNLRLSLWAGDWEWSGAFDQSKVPAAVDVNWAQVYSYTPGAGPDGSDFSLLWRDDFNTKNTSRWYFANWTFDYAVNDYAPGGANVANGYLQLKMTHWDEEGTRFTASPIDDGNLMPPSDVPPTDPPVDPEVPVFEDLSRVYSVPGVVDALLPTRYKDATLANLGAATGCPSNEPLDLYATLEGGCTVGNIDVGEWEEYSLSVAAAGSFRPVIRIASGVAGTTFRISLDGVPVGNTITVPNGGWESYQDLNLPDISLTSGAHVLRIEHLTPGLNLKSIRLVPATDPIGPETTLPLNPMLLPATILAKNYSANLDATEANVGGKCRIGTADLEESADEFGDCNLGWTEAGEWVEYSVYSQEAASYSLAIRAGSALTGMTVQVSVNGTALSSDVSVSTGSWSDFTTLDAGNIDLPAGTSTIRFTFPNGGLNFHWFSLLRDAPEPILPAQVSDLGATPAEGAVQLAWSATANATGYTVERSLDGGLTFAVATTTTATTWSDVAAPQGVATIWRVIAVNSVGSAAPSATVSAMPLPVIVPTAPSDLAASAGDASVTLAWSAVDVDDAYAVFKSVAGGDFIKVATVTAATWSETGLVNGTAYSYKVAGIRGTVTSEPSASVTATPQGVPPSQVTGLVATAGNKQVNLAWTAVAKATVYRIYRATTGTATLVNTTSSTSWADTDVINGTVYTYTVIAANADGDAPASVEVTATPFAVPPTQVTGVVATAGSAQVALSWSASTKATSYKVYRATTGAAVLVNTTTTTSWTDATVVNGTVYTYTVVASNADGDAPASAAVTAAPVAVPPAQVTGVVATAGNAQVALSWTASAKATSYKVYRATTGAATLVNTTTTTAWTDATVVNGTAYKYTVVASNADGDATASVAVTATPSAPSVSLKAQYHPGTLGTTNGIRPLIRIVNTGAVAVDMSKVTVRYWFTKDGATSQNYWCDWAQIGNTNIVSSFVAVSGKTNADNYLQLGFKTSAGTLAAGANTGEIQSRFSKGDWQNYNQANDWSYDATFGSNYADAPKVTVYYNGVKVWGTEP